MLAKCVSERKDAQPLESARALHPVKSPALSMSAYNANKMDGCAAKSQEQPYPPSVAGGIHAKIPPAFEL